MKTSAKYIIMFDFETGGLPNSKQRAYYDIAAVELALVVIDCENLSIIEEKSFIFKDEYKEELIYTKEAEEVHGIKKEVRQNNGVELKIIYKEVCAIFKKYKNPRQMCSMGGHNISFDIPFLRNFFEDMGDNIDNYVKYWIDTLSWAHLFALEQMDYKLSTCCQLAGIDLVDAHRALTDTKANALLLISYIKKLRGEGQTQLSNKKKIRFRNTFELQ